MAHAIEVFYFKTKRPLITSDQRKEPKKSDTKRGETISAAKRKKNGTLASTAAQADAFRVGMMHVDSVHHPAYIHKL